jgi:shikimate dehydrogenase
MFAVLGSPVAHSLSPAMHRAALEQAGIDGDYVAREVDVDGFASAIEDIRTGRLDGANVTMPHKALAFESCDLPSALASRAGAVNTMSRQDNRIIGDNTDVMGIRRAWAKAGLPVDVGVTILGAGGAAAAALLALEGMDLQVVARRPEVAARTIDRTGVRAGVGSWGVPPGQTVVVNATPIGMQGEQVDDRILSDALGLLDMAYGNADTPAVEFMKQQGLPVADGLDMLVGQAVASFEIWTGLSIDPEVMRSAARRELTRRGRDRGVE